MSKVSIEITTAEATPHPASDPVVTIKVTEEAYAESYEYTDRYTVVLDDALHYFEEATERRQELMSARNEADVEVEDLEEEIENCLMQIREHGAVLDLLRDFARKPQPKMTTSFQAC